MIDGIHLIERINARGALIKVLDKPHAARSRLHPPSYWQWPSEEIANRSSSCLIVLTNYIGKVYKPRHSRQKRFYQSAADAAVCPEARLKFGRMLAPGGTALPADQMPTCSRVFEATATAL